MARPTDPEKLAALRARQAANSRAYRARKRAEQYPGTPGSKGQDQQQDNPRSGRYWGSPSSEEAVRRAHAQRARAKARRNEAVSKLPSARNPAVNIYTPREMPTTPAAIPDTAAKRRQRIRVLRENTESQRLAVVGRQRKDYISRLMETDARAESIRENLTKIPGGQARLDSVLARMGRVSQQTMGIYMQYEGGDGDLQGSLTLLAYPKGASLEDALGRLETMADTLEKAEGLYGPKSVGRLRL